MNWRHIPSLVVLLGLLAGCTPRESNVERGDREQILHRGVGVEIPGVDPHLATGTGEYSVLSALLEGLVSGDPVTLAPVPGVAERWETSEDGLSYTFHLRMGATWSNGDPVVASDFIRSWKRVLSPALGADYAYLLYGVANAEAYHKGTITDFSAVGFSAPDERTVRIRLDHPTPHFLSILNNSAWFPVHVASIERLGGVDDRGNPWARPGSFVGNGPFTLREWRANQRIVVEKNPAYWDADAVRLQEIHFHSIESLEAEERAFRTGQLHVTEAVPVSKIDYYRKERPELLRIDPYLGTYFFRVNTARPFLDDVRVRRALAFAMDREAIVARILKGVQLPATALTPPGIGSYSPPPGMRTDFDEARRLLAEAGYPGGKGLPAFEILFNTSENHRLIAEALQEMWRRELGIEIRLANQEFKVTLAARRTGDYQLLRSVWIGDFVDPSTFLGVFTSASGNNHTGWSNRDYDRLIYEAGRTQSTPERNALFQEAESILMADMPILPLFHQTHVFLKQPSVQGWHSNVLDRHPYKHVHLSEPR